MIKTTQYIVVVLLILVFASTRGFAQYNGGVADGTHTDVLMQTSCTNPPQFYAYFGGTADGVIVDILNNTTCVSPPQYFAYMGGIADGASNDQLNNTTCANPVQYYAYFGGSGDGFSVSNKVVNCTTLTPVADFSVSTTTICVGQTITYTDMSTNGPSNWSWTFASGTPSVSSVQNPTVTYNTAGTYATILTATNYNGNNTVVKTNYIVVNALPTLTVSSGSICNGQSFTITSSGASSYTYSEGSAIVSPTITSSYTVTGTDINGCTNTNVAVSTVTVNAIPVISVNSGSICSGNSFIMNPTGANTYTYSSGSNTVTPTGNTTYTVTGSSAMGCIASPVTSSVVVNTIPSLTTSATPTLICNGETATLTVSGANTYIWSTNATNTVISVSPTVTANYTVTGTSVFGCNATAIVTESVSACIGIEALNNNTSIQVYPNPTNGLLNIELVTDINNDIHIQITNTLGQSVYAQTVTSSKTIINTNDFGKGIYFITITKGNRRTTQKVIID